MLLGPMVCVCVSESGMGLIDEGQPDLEFDCDAEQLS